MAEQNKARYYFEGGPRDQTESVYQYVPVLDNFTNYSLAKFAEDIEEGQVTVETETVPILYDQGRWPSGTSLFDYYEKLVLRGGNGAEYHSKLGGRKLGDSDTKPQEHPEFDTIEAFLSSEGIDLVAEEQRKVSV